MSGRPHHPQVDDLLVYIDPRFSWTGYLIAAGTVLSIGLTLSEPSASSGLDWSARFIFWLAHVFCALFFFEFAQISLGRLSVFGRLPPLLLVSAVGGVGALLFSVFSLLALDRIPFLVGNPVEVEPVSMAGLFDELRNSGAASILFWVLLNSPRLIIIARQKAGDEIKDTRPPASLAPAPAAETGSSEASDALLDLLSRLPRRIGTDIVAVSAELHYLRVYCRYGEALILMSYGRAVEALGVIPGQVIHRSHWVALAHVLTVENDGGRVICRMVTGLRLPVSRTHRASLRAALAARNRERALQTVEELGNRPSSDVRG
ncbi:MAG: LytTR family transcriptional regulator [Tabrizicola sp.]|nr:LytTR family transcriptional regulator [Tabrizicola sp.]